MTEVVPFINHVHISESFLAPIEKRQLHLDVLDVPYRNGYDGFESAEMKSDLSLFEIFEIMDYIVRLESDCHF